jgi:NAD+ kinase
MRIGILHHPKIPASLNLANDIDAWLQGRGVDSWTGSSWNAERIAKECQRLDMLIALGGDGTLLRAGRLTASCEVPILGINLGRLGFLAEVQPEHWQEKLIQVLAGEYWIERRLMLTIEAWRDGEPVGDVLDALNEVVVSRGSLARVVRISAEINDSYLTTYVADGVIVASEEDELKQIAMQLGFEKPAFFEALGRYREYRSVLKGMGP